ncbi:MAG: hypothetical protein K2X27_10930 [Candidatus Obscuribacterales bacterium]|nr:hypothetical protein [Candidatus Obscuribacterales bacterium]
MLQAEQKKKVTKSIGDLGRRVTAADVSTKTGLPVLLVSQALNQIASEAGGHLAVSQSGNIVYSFPPGFANTYLAHGLKRFLEKACEQLSKIGLFLLKISFGIMLILSFSIIVITIFILFFSQRGKNSKSSFPHDSWGFRFNLFDYIVLRDTLSYFAFSSQPVKYDYNLPTVRRRNSNNFLLNCFSFLFGDGNPNEGLEEKRWQLIAKVIKDHNNVITAEQLAPYTGADPKNEDAVLPTLVRFNGKPEVTESGNIIYTFPSLVNTAGNDRKEKAVPFLREFPLKFSELDQKALKPVYVIAALNFIGSWFLWFLLHSSKAPTITSLFTLLVTYGSLFLLVPLLRSKIIDWQNKKIEKRNQKRAAAAEALLSPSEELKAKIAESREYRIRDNLIAQSSIIYTTESASLEQEDELSKNFRADGSFDAAPEKTFDANP